MCYGMGCSYEGYMGECTWDGGMPYPCLERHIGQPEKILEDVPGDTLEQKAHRVMHELEVAYKRIAQLEAKNEWLRRGLHQALGGE